MDNNRRTQLLARLSDGRASGYPDPDVCWEWQMSRSRLGYGAWTVPDLGTKQAHRVTWMLLRGPIPDGMYIDHMCRNTSCVNPEHLRVVTPRTNSLENSNGVSAVNKRRTECEHGHGALLPHPYVPGRRVCHICYYASSRDYQARRREKFLAGEGDFTPSDPPKEWCKYERHRLIDEDGNMTRDLLIRHDGRRECRGCHREREARRRQRLQAEASGEERRLSGDSILRSL